MNDSSIIKLVKYISSEGLNCDYINSLNHIDLKAEVESRIKNAIRPGITYKTPRRSIVQYKCGDKVILHLAVDGKIIQTCGKLVPHVIYNSIDYDIKESVYWNSLLTDLAMALVPIILGDVPLVPTSLAVDRIIATIDDIPTELKKSYREQVHHCLLYNISKLTIDTGNYTEKQKKNLIYFIISVAPCRVLEKSTYILFEF